MCGIVGAVAERDVVPVLMEGLRRLEYRGYDSAGVAVVDGGVTLARQRAVGKVQALADLLDANPLRGHTGIAHTRWATHGVPNECNAHPHFAGERVAVVHNGIIENHEALRESLRERGAEFASDTDTEVIAHQISRCLDSGQSLFESVRRAVRDLRGAYAIAVISSLEPDRVVVARRGSPLLIGVGIGEHFVASDVAALLPVTRSFIFLEEGDVAELTRDGVRIVDAADTAVERPVRESALSGDATSKGAYRHFMLKEIFEQPAAINDTWQGRLDADRVLEGSLGPGADALLDQVQGVHIVACGTSSYAGMVARYWMESLAGLPCTVELASEYRYRQPVVPPGTLFLTLSQSGETADTLAALRFSKTRGYAGTLSICNVPESSLVRESGLTLLTRAGSEVGVASTKAFTTQLLALLMVTTLLARRRGLVPETERDITRKLRALSASIEEVLLMDESIQRLAERFVDREHALFLGRGPMYPIAMEGALKLKEIAYIHAEAYAAGELKHGPLALVDERMPVITVAPNNELLEKLKSNLQEVHARGGELFVFADAAAGISDGPGVSVLEMPHADDLVAPIVYTVPLQLLAYHVAVLKGTDVDQPRNLAKSVTVE